MYEELIKELREESEYADLVAYMHGIRPISPEDATAKIARSWKKLFAKAADAIEELQAGEKKFLRNISALEMENENLKRAGRWIPVTERLPNDFQNVLIVFQNSDMAVGFKMTVKTEETILLLWRTMTEEDFCTDCDTPPTHWMPLPTPPKEET